MEILRAAMVPAHHLGIIGENHAAFGADATKSYAGDPGQKKPMLSLEDLHSATDAPVALDHVFFVALALLSPLVDRVWLYPRFVRATQAGNPRARSRFYVSGILTLWGLTACALALWIARRRGWSSLRLGSGTPLRLGFGLALAGLLVALLRSQRRVILSRPAAIERVRGLFGTAGPLLPRTASELRRFAWLSITAGVCEETLFRGYLTWYVGSWTGLVAAVAIVSVLFGFAHIYLGRAHVLRTCLFGAVLAVIVLASGSLWPAMIVHAAMDLNSGDLGFRVFGGDPASRADSSLPAGA